MQYGADASFQESVANFFLTQNFFEKIFQGSNR
jgi:hypothetical protein